MKRYGFQIESLSWLHIKRNFNSIFSMQHSASREVELNVNGCSKWNESHRSLFKIVQSEVHLNGLSAIWAYIALRLTFRAIQVRHTFCAIQVRLTLHIWWCMPRLYFIEGLFVLYFFILINVISYNRVTAIFMHIASLTNIAPLMYETSFLCTRQLFLGLLPPLLFPEWWECWELLITYYVFS